MDEILIKVLIGVLFFAIVCLLLYCCDKLGNGYNWYDWRNKK